MRILVAEDDPVTRRLLQGLLEKWGHKVVATTNGLAALNILQSEDAPQLAVLDWMMPGIDGLEICRHIRQRAVAPYIYILLLTGKSEKQDMIAAMDAGADDYIAKPFDSRELRARLRAGERVLNLESELINARETLRKQATHDPLTGLPNRLLFSDRLKNKLEDSKRHNKQLAVLFLDLDHFKVVNDTLGHNVGDMLLMVVGERLKECLGDNTTFARMGGDEFTILSEIDSPEEASGIAEGILRSLSEAVFVDNREFFVSCSIGISVFPSDGEDVETLVKNADTAMYRAKEKGRNNYQFYVQALNSAAFQRIAMEVSLRKSLERQELALYYQPRVDLKTGMMLGAEALVRWRHPELGIISPSEFIPLAEETGLIIPIGEWVIHEACRNNKAWQDAGLPKVEIAVNAAARQLQDANLTQVLRHALSLTGLDPQYLSIEITESTLMHSPDFAAQTLSELKDLGIHISLDDFGTGYSSLSYLKRFPLDAVKIDQSFVRDITTDPDDAAIAGAVVAMAHSLKLKAVAEGVETLDQLEFLRSLGCDEMQGFFISRPVPAGEFVYLLEEAKRTASRPLVLTA